MDPDPLKKMFGLGTTPAVPGNHVVVSVEPSRVWNQMHIQEPATITSLYKKHLKTFTASFVVALASIGIGTVMSYSSPAIPDLNHHRNPFHLDEAGESWAASVIYISSMCGGALGGILLDKYGRTFVIALTGLSLAIGWLLIVAANNVSWFLIGRLISGFAVAFADVAVPTYVAEIAAPSVRGFLGSCHELGTNIGFLFVFAMGCFLSWNWIAIACMIFPVLLMASLLFIPESPRWLLNQGRMKECAKVLKHFRGGEEDVATELSAIEDILQKSSGSNVQWKELMQPNLYKPLFVIIGLMFFQQMCGYCNLLGYSVEILDSTGTEWNSFLISAWIGFVGTVSNIISALVVDRAGRRVMLLISSGIMIVSQAGLSTFFTVKYFCVDFDISTLSWLPMVSLMTFNFGMAIGYGPIPHYLASELFPLRTRGIAGGIGTFSVAFFAFICVFIFPYLRDNMENYILYWILTCVTIGGMIFAFLAVPETKGKSLEEIEKEYKNS